MHSMLLALHSVLRWVILFDAFVAVVFLARAAAQKRYGGKERALLLSFIVSLDLMFVLGLALWFVSPVTAAARSDVSQAMGMTELRQFLLEHPLLMMAAIAVAHVGNRKAKNAPEPERAKRALVYVGAALLLILVGMPWNRPLLPF